MQSTYTVVAKSLNVAKLTVIDEGTRVGVACFWSRDPSDADMQEAADYVTALYGKAHIGDMTAAKFGPASNGGKKLSEAAVSRFLRTGDPGVPFIKHN